MFLEVEGFIVGETPYKENSKILSIFTKELGLISVYSLGSKKVKSPLRSISQLFNYGNFNIKYKEGKISTLISGDIISFFKNIRSDLMYISYLTYIVDLSVQTYKHSDDKRIYNLFINSVLKLEKKLDPVVLCNILELQYLKFLGVDINLFMCSRCLEKKDIITIDKDKSEFICNDCLDGENIISSKIIKLLRMYYYIDINSINEIIIDKVYKEYINMFLKSYYDSYTGLYLYSKKYIENFKY